PTESTPPPAPAADTSEIGFFDLIGSIAPTEWQNRYVLYVYMVAPKIDLNDNHYLARYNRPMDEEAILRAHGSGRFFCVLNDRKARKGVAQYTFSVYRADCPPKVHISQILRCSENEPYLAWLNNPQPAPTPAAATPAPTAGDGVAVVALAD